MSIPFSSYLSLASIICLLAICSSCTQPERLEKTTPVTAKAEIRYLADLRELSADLRLFRGDSLATSEPYTPPTGSVAFLGSAMEPKSLAGFTRWRSRMRTDFPEKLRFTFPIDSLKPLDKSTINLEFEKIVADSIPTTINKKQRQHFYTGNKRLQLGESIVVFFEPEDRTAKARRVIVAGPSSSNYISIPTEAMTNIAPGNHSVYLVKQSISRDTIPGLVSAVTFQYHTRTQPVRVVEE